MFKFVEYFLNIDIYLFIILFLGISVIYFYLLRNLFLNVFDPIVSFVLTNSFAVTLVTYMAIDKEMSLLDYVFFMLSIVAFWLGYYLVHKHYFKGFKISLSHLVKSTVSDSLLVYLILLWAFMMVLSFVFFASRGVPLFAENPSEAKVLMYAGGFGHVRHVHAIFPPLLFYFSLFYLYVKPQNHLRIISIKRVIVFIVLVTSLGISLATGSKGALLFILGAISILLFWSKYENPELYKKFFRLAIVFASLVGGYFFMILLLTPTSAQDPLFGLFLRLLASGDAFFFYYGFDLSAEFGDKNVLDFAESVANPILAVFRIVEPDYPLGAYLLYYASGFPLSSFGPNSLLPVIADIYFTKYFSLFFMASVGIFVGFIRMILIKMLVRLKYGFGLIIYAFIFSSTLTIFIDFYMFTTQILFFSITVLPFLFFGYLFVETFKKTGDMTSSKPATQ